MKSGYLLSTSLVLIDEQKKYNVTFCVTLEIYQSRFCSLERYSDCCLLENRSRIAIRDRLIRTLINKDFSNETMVIRKELWDEVKQLRQQGIYNNLHLPLLRE